MRRPHNWYVLCNTLHITVNFLRRKKKKILSREDLPLRRVTNPNLSSKYRKSVVCLCLAWKSTHPENMVEIFRKSSISYQAQAKSAQPTQPDIFWVSEKF